MINTVEYIYVRDLEGNLNRTHYQITWDNGNKSTLRINDAEANRHYQEILEWVENGGVIVDNGA
jgi:hypothetical protein